MNSNRHQSRSSLQREAWQAMEIEELFRRLRTNEMGLSTEEAKRRLQEHGPNELLEGKGSQR